MNWEKFFVAFFGTLLLGTGATAFIVAFLWLLFKFGPAVALTLMGLSVAIICGVLHGFSTERPNKQEADHD